MSESKPKQKRKINQKELKLQAEMVLKFSQEYPKRRGDLFATFQTTSSVIQGSNMLSAGLVAGVSDLIYIDSYGQLVGIEVKFPGEYHNLIHILEQCRFLTENAHHGWFCASLEQFDEIIRTDGKWGGIDPCDVVDWCFEKMETKIELGGSESIDDLIFEANKYEKRTKKKMPTIRF